MRGTGTYVIQALLLMIVSGGTPARSRRPALRVRLRIVCANRPVDFTHIRGNLAEAGRDHLIARAHLKTDLREAQMVRECATLRVVFNDTFFTGVAE